jgi:hypothetical protein
MHVLLAAKHELLSFRAELCFQIRHATVIMTAMMLMRQSATMRSRGKARSGMTLDRLSSWP